MDLVNRMFAGGSLRKKLAENRDRLYRVALACCGDSLVADALAHETLVIALRRTDCLRDSAQLNVRLYAILGDCWQRHLGRLRPMIDIDAAGSAVEGDAESVCTEQEVAGLVRRAILNLPMGQRQTLALVDLGRLSYTEVAEVLKIPRATVMSRLHSARQSLLNLLAGVPLPGSSADGSPNAPDDSIV